MLYIHDVHHLASCLAALRRHSKIKSQGIGTHLEQNVGVHSKAFMFLVHEYELSMYIMHEHSAVPTSVLQQTHMYVGLRCVGCTSI